MARSVHDRNHHTRSRETVGSHRAASYPLDARPAETSRQARSDPYHRAKRISSSHRVHPVRVAGSGSPVAGNVRLPRNTPSCGWEDPPDVASPVSCQTSGAGDAGPWRFLDEGVPRRPERIAWALSETPLA